MSYTIQQIDDKHLWQSFFALAGSPSFHQSWEWGEFQKLMGYEILRLGVYDSTKLQAIALVIHIKARRGDFFFVPHGPLFDFPTIDMAYDLQNDKQKELAQMSIKTLTHFLAEKGKENGCTFIRIAPPLKANIPHQELFQKNGYRPAPVYMHAETMWVLDISPSEEELFAGMRKNCRYGVKKGLKDQIQTFVDTGESAPDRFWKLYQQTFTRESFIPFSARYVRGEYEEFKKEQNALFIFGELPSKFAQEGASGETAASLVLFTPSAAFYHQGASLHTREPVPYMVQWRTILEAKKRGCRYYNFYGIYKAGRTPRSWEGLSLFKRGFGGFELDYLPTQDYILSPKYWLTYAYERYLNYRRGV